MLELDNIETKSNATCWCYLTGVCCSTSSVAVGHVVTMIPPACRMNDTKLEVCENEEEPELSDVDDDVFVRGRSNGFRLELYDNAKKPLMAPRKKPVSFEIQKLKP